jgi:predicted dehydrogenase
MLNLMLNNRRQFLKAVAAAPMFVPASAFGANDRPTYAAIGIGNRGGWLNQSFQKLGAQCVALCDVYEPNIESARAKSPSDAKAYVNHRDALAHPGVDFVVIAAPDHHHGPMLMDALAAGKDVYLEKPLSTSLEQSKRMVAAVRASKQIVQVGMQRRSMPFIRHARQLIDDGALGKVSLVKAMWNWNLAVPLDNEPLPGKLDWDLFLGEAPKRPLEPKRFRWWRAFWDYCGGNMTDQGTHLMDVIQWLTNSPPPRSAVCQGFINAHTGGEVPDVFSAAFEYPDFIATWTLDYSTSYDYDWSITFVGDKASMLLNRHGSQVFQDHGRSPQAWSDRGSLKVIATEEDQADPGAHQQNFLDCVRSRKEPNCPIEIAAAAVTGPHLANIAYRGDRKAKLG